MIFNKIPATITLKDLKRQVKSSAKEIRKIKAERDKKEVADNKFWQGEQW